MKKLLLSLLLIGISITPNAIQEKNEIIAFNCDIEQQAITWTLVETGDLRINGDTIEEFASLNAAKNYDGKYIQLPNASGQTITKIYESAFEFRKHDIVIKGIKLPSALKEIGDFAFASNQIEVIEWPATSLDSIGIAAFTENKLTEVSIPKSVSLIDAAAFSSNNITTLNIDSGSLLEEISASAFESNELTVLPALNTITDIGRSAFKDNKITALPSMSSLISIGDSAFENNEITTIESFEKLEVIGKRAFKNNKLTDVNLTNLITKIDDYAFENNQLNSVQDFPELVTEISNGVYKDNQIVNVEIPEHVTSIGKSAFEGNELESVIFNEGLIFIDERAFAVNYLETVTFPKSILEIETSAFGWNLLTKVNYRGITAISWGRRHTQYDAFNDNPLSDGAFEMNFGEEPWHKDKHVTIDNFNFPFVFGIVALIAGLIAALVIEKLTKKQTLATVDGAIYKMGNDEVYPKNTTRQRETSKDFKSFGDIAILPVNVTKNGKVAKQIEKELSMFFNVQYDDMGPVQQRQHTYEELGVSYFVVVGDQASQKGYVQVRSSDGKHPEEVNVKDLVQFFNEKIWKDA